MNGSVVEITSEVVACGASIRTLLSDYNAYAEKHQPISRDLPGWQELTPTSEQVGEFMRFTFAHSIAGCSEPYILPRRPSYIFVAQGAVAMADLEAPMVPLRELYALKTGDAREQLRAVAFVPAGVETIMRAITHPTTVVIISWLSPDAIRSA